MDKIILSGIEVYAHGGATLAEREIGHRYRVDLELRLDLSRAAESDDLRDTFNYARAHDLVVEALRSRHFSLLESAAGDIARRLLVAQTIQGVTVRLQKLLPPIDGMVAYAAVEISRERAAEPPA
ncbi:MAG: dihydroneopterin aldolase [Chloroflexota bacterium]